MMGPGMTEREQFVAWLEATEPKIPTTAQVEVAWRAWQASAGKRCACLGLAGDGFVDCPQHGPGIRSVDTARNVMADFRRLRIQSIKDGKRPDEDAGLSIDAEARAVVRALV